MTKCLKSKYLLYKLVLSLILFGKIPVVVNIAQ